MGGDSTGKWRHREPDNTVRHDLAAFQSEPNGILLGWVEALPANELEKKNKHNYYDVKMK